MGEQRGLELTIPAGDGYPATPAYAVLPPGATRGVVIIYEIMGRQPEIDRVVERFGRAGYAAVEPDLFRAQGRIACLRHTFEAMRTGAGPVVRHAAGVRRWLCEQSGVPEGKVGIIGFCFGGGFALAVGRGWGAVSTNYGQIPEREAALRGMGPTIGCYGGRDRIFGGLGPVLEGRLRPLGVPVEAHTFPEVGHSFLTDGHHPIAAALTRPFMHVDYRPETAEEGWRRIMTFFDQHLA
jgi:carboxymethylenebutenolidase